MIWEHDNRQYTSGEILKLGKWIVGTAYYDSGRSRDDPCKYAAKCSLPGIKLNLGFFESSEEAKARVERAVNHWIEHAELNKKRRSKK